MAAGERVAGAGPGCSGEDGGGVALNGAPFLVSKVTSGPLLALGFVTSRIVFVF